MKRAQSPSAIPRSRRTSRCSGCATAISPSIRITRTTSSACGKIGEHRGRPGLVDHGARADEQPGADHAAERDHRHVAALEAALETTPVSTMPTDYPRIAVIHHLQQPFLGNAAAPLGRGRGALRRRCRTSTASTGSSPSAASRPRGTRRWSPRSSCIREAVAREIPFLGVCLGAQLLARAHGGENLAPASAGSSTWAPLTVIDRRPGARRDPARRPRPALERGRLRAAARRRRGLRNGREAAARRASASAASPGASSSIRRSTHAALDGWYADWGERPRARRRGRGGRPRARTPAISPVRRRSRPRSSAPSRAWCRRDRAVGPRPGRLDRSIRAPHDAGLVAACRMLVIVAGDTHGDPWPDAACPGDLRQPWAPRHRDRGRHPTAPAGASRRSKISSSRGRSPSTSASAPTRRRSRAPKTVFRRLSEMGYRNVEPFTLSGLTASAVPRAARQVRAEGVGPPRRRRHAGRTRPTSTRSWPTTRCSGSSTSAPAPPRSSRRSTPPRPSGSRTPST